MIDIHSHILPELDDGAGSLQEALDMARLAVADGIRSMAATPHVETGLYPNTRETVLQAVDGLRRALQEHAIPLTILPGAEYRLEPDLPRRLARGELLTLNDKGRYLLVELPATLAFDFTVQVFYELQLGGVIPVIAHPERNAAFAATPSLLYNLIARGALAQITAGSLTGHFGPAARAAARAFLKNGCAHFIATDAHSDKDRAPLLTPAKKEAARLLGEEEGHTLVAGNPQRAVEALLIETGEIEETRPARSGFWSFLSRLVIRK